MKTISEEKFESLIQECHLTLKVIGFKKKGTNFFLKREGFGQHINFQKSQFGTKDHITFTINTGIFLPEYWRTFDYNRGKAIPDFPSYTDCMLIKRIGQIKQDYDIWWDVNIDTNLSEITDTVLKNINNVIIPYFERIKTKKELIKLINSQPYSGTPFWDKLIDDLKNETAGMTG